MLLILGAVVCFGATAALLISAGLPQRSDFTGQLLQDGRRVAPEVGAIAPDFTAITTQGEEVGLSQYRGEPVIINFWATWCAPCRVEMPELQRLHDEQGIPILAVNRAESERDVRRWVDEFGLSFDVLLDPDEAVAEAYWLRDVPSTYIISAYGTITQIYFGPVSAEQLHGAVLPLLE